jgi:aerobic C4-dicarboxylate transport protein
VLVLALFVGFGITRLAPANKQAVVDALMNIERIVFAIIGFIMKVAPLAVVGAMAFVASTYGLATIASLAKLVATLYAACILFIGVALTLAARISGFSLWKFLKYLREEIVLAFATASGEAVLPRLVAKLEHVGCSGPVVGFVLPTGYSFNLDGGSIYLTVTALFIAQAFDVHLSFVQQLTMIGIFLLTSKGIAGVAGAGVVVLASSLLMMPQIPLVGLALAISVDRLSDPIRTVTNVLGNSVATMFVAWWVGERDDVQMNLVLGGTQPVGNVEAAALSDRP